MKRIRFPVRGDGPALGEIAHHLAGLVRIVVEQPAVDPRGGLLDHQGRLGVHVEATGVAVVEPVEDAARPGLLLGDRRSRH